MTHRKKHLKYYSNNHNDFYETNYYSYKSFKFKYCSLFSLHNSVFKQQKKIYTTKTQRDTKCVEEY